MSNIQTKQYHVSELVAKIKDSVEQSTGTKIINVIGEVSECKLARGTMYITLNT